MALTPGSRVGPYEITALLGEGGMGQVYRATDTHLKRQVAIKVLPASVAGDADRLARFQREAEVLAALNHPHIAAIYGLEKPPELTALVMELVEGADLSDRIARGPLPLDEALAIARQIAEALEAAHEQGIVHRDLKPANVKVRDDGTVKVLDFGLAKAMDPAASSSGEALQAATITTPAMTQAGMILGTAAYMAPEQAKGRPVDKRADVWAFGAVLYEMLTGVRAFKGEDVSDTLARVLMQEPDWALLPSATPASVVAVLKRCLQKDRRQRLRDMGDVALALDGAFETAAPQTTTAASAAPGGRMAWMAALAVASGVAIALAVPAVRHLREAPAPSAPLVHLTMGVAPAQRLGPTQFLERASRTAFAIDPAGTTIVFAGDVESNGTRTTLLYRRPLAAAEATPLPGTEGAEYPFFSPDGQWIGFGTANKLKKVAIGGGPPIDICDLPTAGTGVRIEGASWGPAGVIVFANRGLWTVSSDGGTPDLLVEGDVSVRTYSPTMLPGDAATVLFTVVSADHRWEEAHVDAVDVSTKARKTVLTGAADARYVPTGHLAFMRDATLLAVPFDAARVEVRGAAVPLLAGVMQSTNANFSGDETGMGQYALSASGTLVYAAGGRYPNRASHLVRVTRKGEQTPISDMPGAVGGLRVVPPGSRMVAYRIGDGSRAVDLWMWDLATGTPSRLTSSGQADSPVVAPDGKSLAFRDSTRGYTLSLVGGRTPEPMADAFVEPASWSRDGKWMAFLREVNGVRQIFVAPVRDGTPDTSAARQISASTYFQHGAEFSPDGRWIAYTSNESGAQEVYVLPFPGPGERRRLSSSGGTNPAWSADGRELFFAERRQGDRWAMMAMDVSTAGEFTAGRPRPLFEASFRTSTPLRSYDVTPDGQFLMSLQELPPAQPVSMLHVVIGWAGDLATRVPAGK